MEPSKYLAIGESGARIGAKLSCFLVEYWEKLPIKAVLTMAVKTVFWYIAVLFMNKA